MPLVIAKIALEMETARDPARIEYPKYFRDARLTRDSSGSSRRNYGRMVLCSTRVFRGTSSSGSPFRQGLRTSGHLNRERSLLPSSCKPLCRNPLGMPAALPFHFLEGIATALMDRDQVRVSEPIGRRARALKRPRTDAGRPVIDSGVQVPLRKRAPARFPDVGLPPEPG